jgi:EpsI family protein
MRNFLTWSPALILSAGVLMITVGVREQLSMELLQPLDATVPGEIVGYTARDIEIDEAQRRVAGMTDYIMRVYKPIDMTDDEAAEAKDYFSVYVGWYDRQFQGKTIHSPRNCLPGGGWEPLTHSRETIATRSGEVPVNRYLIGNGPAKAIVLYWYQGRGRVEANEYLVKWDLLRDQALYGRSDEALVRVIVPVSDSEEAAYQKAVQVAAELVPAVFEAIPE